MWTGGEVTDLNGLSRPITNVHVVVEFIRSDNADDEDRSLVIQRDNLACVP